MKTIIKKEVSMSFDITEIKKMSGEYSFFKMRRDDFEIFKGKDFFPEHCPIWRDPVVEDWPKLADDMGVVEFKWSGVDSGRSYNDGRLALFCSKLIGYGEFVLFWDEGATWLVVTEGKAYEQEIRFSGQGPYKHLPTS
jgi:hypothetical protein